MKKRKGKGTSKKEETVTVEVHRDKLAEEMAKAINKGFDFKAVRFLTGDTEESTDVTEWISTGDDILDLRISNKPYGGVPVGKISEFNGLESSGKSLIVAHLIAETQKRGGVAILFDTEFSASPEFLTAIGVDTTNLLHVELECLEDIFSAIENMIVHVREKYKDRLVLIAVDSIAGATTKVEMEQDYDKEGWATAKAIIMSKAMRKLTGLIAKQRIALVFTNQLREKLGVMFGDKYTTSGGKALGFHASVRCRLAKLGQIKVGKEPIGIIVQAKVIKNRLGPPLRTCDINIFFDRGIDRYGSWLNALKVQKLIDVSGKTITIGSTTISKNKWNETLATDSKLREDVYKIICDAYIMKYKSSAETVDGDFEESGDDD